MENYRPCKAPGEEAVRKKAGCDIKMRFGMAQIISRIYPNIFFPHYAKLTHGKYRVSKGGMIAEITSYWLTK